MFDISHSLPPSVFLALRLHAKRLAHQLAFLFLQAEHALFHGIGHNILQMKKQLLHHCLVSNREGWVQVGLLWDKQHETHINKQAKEVYYQP